jgi:hypothetical protein
MPLPRGLSLEAQPHVPEIPVGLPSVLLAVQRSTAGMVNRQWRPAAAV